MGLAAPAPLRGSTGAASSPEPCGKPAGSAGLLFVSVRLARQSPRATGLLAPEATAAPAPASSFSGSAQRPSPAHKTRWRRQSPGPQHGLRHGQGTVPAALRHRLGDRGVPTPAQQTPRLHRVSPLGQPCWQRPHPGMTENVTTSSHSGKASPLAPCQPQPGQGLPPRERRRTQL